MRKQLDHVSGAAAGAQKIMEQTPAKQWEIFTNKVQALEIVIGRALFPAGMKVLNVLGRIVAYAVNFAQAHPALVKFVTLFAA